MKNESVNKLLEEIINCPSYINIDFEDVEQFKKGVDYVDAIKVCGKPEDSADLLENAISTLKKANEDKLIYRVLLNIKACKGCLMTKQLQEMSHVLEQYGLAMFKQGICYKENSQDDNIELIIAVGLK